MRDQITLDASGLKRACHVLKLFCRGGKDIADLMPLDCCCRVNLERKEERPVEEGLRDCRKSDARVEVCVVFKREARLVGEAVAVALAAAPLAAVQPLEAKVLEVPLVADEHPVDVDRFINARASCKADWRIFRKEISSFFKLN